MIRQIGAKSQFSARFRAYHPPEPKYLFAVALKNLRPTPLGNDAPEEKLRLHVHTNSGHGNYLSIKILQFERVFKNDITQVI
jgi:hypothetical protein